MKAIALAATLGLLAPAGVRAQEPPARWSGSVAAYAYFVPEEDDFVLPIVKAERGPIHLEARYNYEERGAASLWFGWTFSLGSEEKGTVALTPMLGGVFGDLSAVAPGVELDLAWKELGFYFEGEYVRDLDERDASFAYAWSELTWAPVEWFRAGVVGQRTRLVDTDLDVQRGLLVGFTYRRLDIAGYFFNPGGGGDAFEIVSLAVDF